MEIAGHRIAHIFRDAPGHLSDTPDNRMLLIEVASQEQNFLGRDEYDNLWYAWIGADGRQVWAQVRQGQIQNGGVNEPPRPWNEATGLASPRRR